MECGSPSRQSWANEVEEEEAARSPSNLNPNAEPFVEGASPYSLGSSLGGRLSFTDSEDYSGSEAPPADERGKAPVVAVVHRRRHRRRQRRARVVGGFMADVRRSHPADVAEVAPWVRSVVNHPAHTSSVPDAEGFHQVHSRRRWRWK